METSNKALKYNDDVECSYSRRIRVGPSQYLYAIYRTYSNGGQQIVGWVKCHYPYRALERWNRNRYAIYNTSTTTSTTKNRNT
jgi:hypothetical protein